jgi:hypothetical protein
MEQTCKIARLPRQIREELNRRLESRVQNKLILEWVNALPEVQALLAKEFEGNPINKQNLSAWKSSGFLNWQMAQTALQFTENSLPDDLDQDTLEKMSAKIIRCLQLRYAAVASSLPAPGKNPQNELNLLANLCSNRNSMRRGDLSAGRLEIEQQRFALEKSRSEDEMEKQFWQWTQRPDIHAKLYPHRDKEKIRREVERMLNRRLLGIRDPDEVDEHDQPAVLI